MLLRFLGGTGDGCPWQAGPCDKVYEPNFGRLLKDAVIRRYRQPALQALPQAGVKPFEGPWSGISSVEHPRNQALNFVVSGIHSCFGTPRNLMPDHSDALQRIYLTGVLQMAYTNVQRGWRSVPSQSVFVGSLLLARLGMLSWKKRSNIALYITLAGWVFKA